MSFYDDASLILYPSGYKADKLYSLKPTNGDGDFDFSRASTATRVDESGLIETVATGVPRIDYTGGGCGSLLLEPQRTNLFTYSEFINGLSFTNATATDNAETSPDGTVNAARLYDDTADSQHRVSENISVVNTETYTWSTFAKQGNLRYCYLISTAAGTERYFFDLQEGLSLTSGGKIEDYGNGWYRLSAQITATSTGNALFGFNLTDSSSNRTYIGTGTDYHIVYGLQTEVGSYISSYIKTAGATATRIADTCSGAGTSATFNDSEGVLYFEAAKLNEADTSAVVWSISDGSNSNAISMYYYSGGVAVDVFNTLGTKSLTHSMTLTEQANFNKVAIKYKSNDIGLWVNGSEVATNTDAIALSGLNQLMASYGSGSLPFYGNTKQLMTFNTALTDLELAALTTI